MDRQGRAYPNESPSSPVPDLQVKTEMIGHPMGTRETPCNMMTTNHHVEYKQRVSYFSLHTARELPRDGWGAIGMLLATAL